MGRRKIVAVTKNSPRNCDILKRNHRVADTKYRSKVQQLFQLLKDEILETTTKDNLLTNLLFKIQSTEEAIGSNVALNSIQAEFLNLLHIEEKMWKKEKNVEIWWSKLQDKLENVSLVFDHEIDPESTMPCDIRSNLEDTVSNSMKNYIRRFERSICKHSETEINELSTFNNQSACYIPNSEYNPPNHLNYALDTSTLNSNGFEIDTDGLCVAEIECVTYNPAETCESDHEQDEDHCFTSQFSINSTANPLSINATDNLRPSNLKFCVLK